MLRKQMCICLRFSAPWSKIPHWKHIAQSSGHSQLYRVTLPAELYQRITASSTIHKLPDTPIYLTEFLHIYRIRVVMEVSYLSDLVPTYRFAFVFLTQEHALWFIIYWYHLQQHRLRHQQIYLKSAASKKMQVLQIWTINVVQDPAVRVLFCIQVFIFSNFVSLDNITRTVK